jgi:hypothetical protein
MTDWLIRKTFVRASGQTAHYKIEEEGLSDEEIETAAKLIAESVPPFRDVLGVPRGGLRLSSALEKYRTSLSVDPLLVVDDVWTTGGSMRLFIAKHQLHRLPLMGAVMFAINPPESWVFALFQQGSKRVP